MNNMRGGRMYRVMGANQENGEDVEMTVEAMDEADAARLANRRGVFVSSCVAAGAGAAPSGPPAMTFSQVLAEDGMVRSLVKRFPLLDHRLKRLSERDQAYLSDLVNELAGVTHRESLHMACLIRDNRHLPRT